MGSIDYSTLGSPSGYTIKPNVTWKDPKNRRLKVLTVGAGVSGILMAYLIQKHCENVEHVIYEKNAELGGTWQENNYPGAGCDIPSHAYVYAFALNPDWPRFFSYAPDIKRYLTKVVETFDLQKYITFNTEVIGAYWVEEKGQWQVKLRQRAADGSSREFEEFCEVFLYASGILNNYKWPEIEGLHEFQGKVIHTAAWPADYGPEQWKQDRVAVIGSGASSIQTVPTMQPHTKSLEVFVRTGVWFVDIAGNAGHNKEYSVGERKEFRSNPSALVKEAKSVEDRVNGLWGAFYSDTEAQTQAQTLFKQRMAEFIQDERLLQGFTPKFGVGCRRITPGDPYMTAITKENVNVHFTAVKSCTSRAVVGFDGTEREVDTVVCATGFDVSYKPRFPIVGKNGVNLRKKWTDNPPEGYLGLAVPDMPNFLFFIGPSWPVENGSVMGPLHNVGEYAIQWITKIQNENIRSFAPRQDVTDSFNEHVQEWIKHTVWKDSCRSWYKDNETGRVNAVYPGSSMHYQKLIEVPRYEDFEIQHFDSNPWAFLGFGWTQENRLGGDAADCSPYLTLENIDPEWYKACGGSVDELKRQRDDLLAQKPRPSGIARYL